MALLLAPWGCTSDPPAAARAWGSGGSSGSTLTAGGGAPWTREPSDAGAREASAVDGALRDASSVDGAPADVPEFDAGVIVVGAEGPSCSGDLECVGMSCCRNTLVPGGPFPMGRSEDGTDACPNAEPCGTYELPEHTVTVPPFFLDSLEVTVGRFRKFVAAFDGTQPMPGAGAHALVAGSGWRQEWNVALPSSRADLVAKLACSNLSTWTDAPAGNENFPMGCVTWFEAFAFCAWDGGWLPTEAEWEFAAAGGADNRLYPWGNGPPDTSRAVFGCAFGGTPLNCTPADLPPVGSAPAGASKWGQRDLAGSTWEWILDTWHGGWDACNDDTCTVVGGSGNRVVRGGDYTEAAYRMRAADRGGSAAPEARGAQRGFRCGRDAP